MLSVDLDLPICAMLALLLSRVEFLIAGRRQTWISFGWAVIGNLINLIIIVSAIGAAWEGL